MRWTFILLLTISGLPGCAQRRQTSDSFENSYDPPMLGVLPSDPLNQQKTPKPK